MVFAVIEIVFISQQEISKRKSAETWLAGGAEIEGSAGYVRLCIVIIPSFELHTEVISVAPTHQSQIGREVVLGIAILNKTLPLGTHDVVGKVGDAGSGRRPHDRRDGRV